MTIIVRPAGAADAEEIAQIRIASWRAAYAGIVPAPYLDGLDLVDEVAIWHERLTGPGAVWMRVAYLLEPPGPPRLVGYVAAGPARHAGEDGLGEVWAVYVDPGAQGRGVGRALLDTAVRGLATRGFGEAVLWVFEANAPARRFYERMGWEPDGAAKAFAVGGAAPVELRYRRRLR